MNKKINMNVNMTNMNMKGLRKGLKYIAQVFEEEQKDDNEIVIGNPTDVKHVAHIGWDGPAANSTPSWMDEFKSNGDANSSSVDDSSGGKVKEKDSPGLPKGSRRQASADSLESGDSPGSSPPKASKKSKDKDKSRARRQSKDKDKDSSTKGSTRSITDEELSSDLPNIPKKTSRRKKSKDDGASVKSSRKSGDPSSRSKHGKKNSLSEEGSTNSYNANDVVG